MDNNSILNTILGDRLHVSLTQITQFCNRWQVTEFALFGSILRDDFNPLSSDVDVLLQLKPDVLKGLSMWLDMKDELEALFGRHVDLVSKVAIQESPNWIRKRNILNSALVIYGQ